MKLHPHGSRNRYISGACRCQRCRDAHAAYERDLRRTGPRSVSADEVRAHICKLAESGVGSRAIADAADVDRHSVQWIKRGLVQRVHVSTARRILSVDAAAIANRALVPAAPARVLIAHLVDGGYTKRWISHQLGYKATLSGLPYTITHGPRIAAITASRIERLYRRIQDGRVSR